MSLSRSERTGVPDQFRIAGGWILRQERSIIGALKRCATIGSAYPLTGGVSMSKSKKITVDQLVAAMPAAISRAVKNQENRPQIAASDPIVGFLPND
jgi:hypothetical protein